ncbi:MAG: hypothetical protein M3361_00460 [Candidatus Tectomicrobia bacterium]|nr:hypothetical protein [Candidatus Tectomicrobia bacterium]
MIAHGARWTWKQAQALFPSAAEILDYYHCHERLHKVAALQYGPIPSGNTKGAKPPWRDCFMVKSSEPCGGCSG